MGASCKKDHKWLTSMDHTKAKAMAKHVDASRDMEIVNVDTKWLAGICEEIKKD